MARGKILVTGGCGYIGSHVVKQLIKSGYDVIVIDDFSTGSRQLLNSQATLVEGDFADSNLLNKIFSTHQIDTIMHFAASISVPESVENPKKYEINNAEKSRRLWEVAVAHGIPHIIFSSTAAVYGPVEVESVTEEHPTHPQNPYGATKLAAEYSLKEITQGTGTTYVIFRYFNAAGADPEGELGQNPAHAHHLIACCFDVAGGKKSVIEIYGDDYQTPDGTCIRDYIHVHDLATAHLAALKYLYSGGISDTFNLGSGKGYSVRQIIQAVQAVTDQKIPVKIAARRPGDVAKVIASHDKFTAKTHWKPVLLDLQTTIKQAWNWYTHTTHA